VTSLVAELAGIVGDEHVITHEHQLRTYESDGLLQYAVTPGAVALPGSADEVRRVVAACHRSETPFVARRAAPARASPAGPCRSRTAC
jgi:glycolate oxidase